MEELLVEHGVKRSDRLVAINPGAGRADKRWPVARLTAVAERLATEAGARHPAALGTGRDPPGAGDPRRALRAGDPRAADRPRRAGGPAAPRRPRDRQRHGAAAPGGGARHAVSRALRTDASRAQRAVRAALSRAAESRRHHGGARSGRGVPTALEMLDAGGVARVTRLTVTIIAWNEEERLRACLESVAWADEIVVVDAESTDKTAALAREFTDRVWVRPWPGFAVQKNFALEQATGEWILSLDADERVTPELAVPHPGHRRRGRAGRRLLRSAQEPLLGRLGAPRRPLSRLSAPAVPPGRGALRGGRRPRVGDGGRARGDAGRGAAPPVVSRPRGLRPPLQPVLHARRAGLDPARAAGERARPRHEAPRRGSSRCTL